jgi:ribonucleoside-diphosphate reductase beta chain
MSHLKMPEWKQHYFDPNPPKRLKELYKKAQKAFWDPEEIRTEIATDIEQIRTKLTAAEKRVISIVLAHFTTADSIVDDYLKDELIPYATLPIARFFWRFQMMIEDIHAETYGMFLEAYPLEDKDRLRSAMESIPCIQRKIELYRKHRTREIRDQNGNTTVRPLNLSERLLVQACAEMIQFSASLCVPMEFSCRRKLLPALGNAIKLIVIDEGSHGEFACEYHRIVGLADLDWIHETVREFVDAEMEFVDYLLAEPLIGLTAPGMKQYVRYVADRMLGMLDLPAIFGDSNPYEGIMIYVGSASKTSLHDRHPTEYQTVTKETLEEDPFADF